MERDEQGRQLRNQETALLLVQRQDARRGFAQVRLDSRIDREDRVLVVGLPQAQPATAWQVGQ